MPIAGPVVDRGQEERRVGVGDVGEVGRVVRLEQPCHALTDALEGARIGHAQTSYVVSSSWCPSGSSK